jgi:hypothetical protein
MVKKRRLSRSYDHRGLRSAHSSKHLDLLTLTGSHQHTVLGIATPAVVLDNFVYSDAFFAQVDENKRHPRASVVELTSLLRPEASSNSLPRDQVGHWYQAQLLHYGSPPNKDKNTAKVRLLQAINANTLAVPVHVAKLEKDMKKEFTAAAKKAKAAEKLPAAPAKGKKRTLEEATTSTKITLTVGGVSITVDQQTAASITPAVAAAGLASKKAKVTKDSTTTARVKLAKDETPAVKPKKSAQSTESTKSKSTSTTEKPAKNTATTKPRAKTAAVQSLAKVASAKPKAASKPKDAPSLVKPKAEPKSKKPTEETPVKAPARKKQTARRSKPWNPYASDRPSAEQPQHIHDHTSDNWNELPHIKSESNMNINGTYLLHLRSHSPDNVHEFDRPPRISIHYDILTDKLWGRFVIGSKTGVIRVDDFYLDGSRVCNFNWRARDMGSGQLRFGRGCEGVMEFGIRGVD